MSAVADELPRDRYLTTPEAAEILGHQPRTLEWWRWAGEGPPYLRLNNRILYPESRLYGWLEETADFVE